MSLEGLPEPVRRYRDNGAHGRRRYIPCGGDAHAERRFGDVVIPSRLTAGWWYGTPRNDPFCEAEIHAAEPITASRSPASA